METVEYELEKAKSSLEQDMSATKYKLATAKQDLSKAILQKPFSAQRIIDAEDAVTALQKGYDRAAQMLTDYFPTEEAQA